MVFATERQHLTQVVGDDGRDLGLFARISARETTAESRREFDGGDLVGEVLVDPPLRNNITLSRGYKPERDQSLCRYLDSKVGTWTGTLSTQDATVELSPYGAASVYPKARLISLSWPGGDARSGTTREMVLVFAVSSVA